AAAFQGRQSSHTGKWIIYYGKTSSRVPGNFDLDILIFTFAAGRLVFQVVAPKWLRLQDAHRRLPEVAGDPIWDTATVRVWPPDGFPVSWPPRFYLDHQNLYA